MTPKAKDLLGRIAFYTGVYRFFFRNKAVVVLFHRVDDRYPEDPISCSRQKFTSFCEFFSRFFIVVPLSELVDRLAAGKDIGRHLAITFDDGYLDNSQTAAPELLRMQLPACFFIATELIGSTRVPPWDAEAGIKSEWMNWTQVRGLHADAFEIGAHTCNHVDLGIVAGAEARAEIVESGRRLSAETGAPVTMFSYPFGRINQITEENRELVREAAYRCCVSAYGGCVPAGTDQFRIRRTSISPWHRSPYQFGLEAMLDD